MSVFKVIGFLGGTGIEGKGLALRFAAAGLEVVIGSRSDERARAAAKSYNEVLGRPLVRGATNSEMLSLSPVVFLTVPADQVASALDGCRDGFRPGQILVDVTVPVAARQGQIEYREPSEGSNAELVSRLLPREVLLVGAFKTLPAHLLADLDTPLECDVFICGDSQEARARVIQLVQELPGVRALDAGPLGTARTLERMTVLAIRLNRRYRSRSARFRVLGI